MSNQISRPRFERIAQVAKRLSVSERTVYRMSRAGKLPPIIRLHDNTVAMDGVAIDKWMQAKASEAARTSA